MKLRRYFPLTVLLLVLLMLATPVFAATLPPLGTAASFGVLAGSTVTNTGSSQVTGDLGVSPGSAVTGFPPGIVSGTIHRGDSVALQAQNDVTIAYNIAVGQPCDTDLTGQDLGGKTLTAGVYCFAAAAQLTGQVTLDGQGKANSVFIFKIGSTLTTASSARVQLINGAQPCNVFWQVGSSATLGTTTTFMGNILALTSITLNTGASSIGGMYARNGAVTLDSNQIQGCGPVPTPTPTNTPGLAVTTTPRPTRPPPEPSDTPVPLPSDTPVPLPSDTPLPPPLPSDTPVTPPSSTPPLPPPSDTPVTTPPPPLPSDTPVTPPSGTPMTSTPPPLPSDTPVTPPSGTPPLPPPSNTPVTTPPPSNTPGPPTGLPPTGSYPHLGTQVLAVALLLLGLGYAFRLLMVRRARDR